MSTVEKHSFQAEIRQLLDIVIHSLYTDREIFIRELISNAADACEKLRFLQNSGEKVTDPDLALGIRITTDEKAGTITFADSGIGMTQTELVENLGTIAHSGTKAFLKQLSEEKKGDAKLIGQFGVGFYSAFMVAQQVKVTTKSWRAGESPSRWTSEGTSGYDLEPVPEAPRGSEITLQLKPEAVEFAKADHVEQIIKRYSSFVPFPIELNGKRLNTVQALWTRSRSEIKEEEYNEFYQYVGHDHEAPLLRLHFSADAPLAIQSLLFVPKTNLETLGMGRIDSEVNLYCKKVLIQAKAKHLFPEWLRFLKGVVDSEDLPLNISRETMQDSALMQKLNKVLTTRFLKFLDETSEKQPEQYSQFYSEYSRFLKEGVVTDFTHREALGKLLRYESSTTDPGKPTSISEYVKRMPSEQTEIYFLLAPNRESALSSPYYEVFASRKFEVLFLTDPWDEFVMEHLHTFEGKTLKAAEKADLNLASPSSGSLTDEQAEGLAKWLKESLSDRVHEVRVSKRLVDSPAVVVDSDRFMTASMRKLLRGVKRDGATPGPAQCDFEINPSHRLIAQLESLRQKDSDLASKVAAQLYDHARVAAGLLEDPREMLKRANELLAALLEAKQP